MTNLDQAEKAIKFGAARGYTPEGIATLLRELDLLAPDLPPVTMPKPEDCKEEDVYRAKMDYNGQRGFGVAVRCNPEDFYTPWSVTLDDGDHWWVDDSAVTLLARLLPDREV